MQSKRLFPVLLLMTLCCSGQTSQGSPGFLFRLQRTTPAADTCLLVQSDGAYRLEVDDKDKEVRRVFDGTLSASRITQVKQQLQHPALAGLAQEQIMVPPLESRDIDVVTLSVDRPLGTQNLYFRSVEGRAVVKAPLDSLLELMRDLRKDSNLELAQSKANHCLPPAGDPTLKRRSSTQGAASETPPSRYLVAMKEHMQRGYSLAERRCVVVFADGRYRLEQSRQEADQAPKGQVFEDTISLEALRQLRELLASEELRDAQSAEMPKNIRFQEGETTLVLIPRGPKVQMLAFGSGFAARVGALHSLQNAGFGNDRPLKPLLGWMKALTKQKVAPSPGAVFNDCNDAEAGP